MNLSFNTRPSLQRGLPDIRSGGQQGRYLPSERAGAGLAIEPTRRADSKRAAAKVGLAKGLSVSKSVVGGRAGSLVMPRQPEEPEGQSQRSSTLSKMGLSSQVRKDQPQYDHYGLPSN